MATTLDDFTRILGLVPYGEPLTRALRLLQATEQRCWRVWASMQVLAPTNTITVDDVARWERLRLNLFQAELRIREDMLNAAGPLRAAIEQHVPVPQMLPVYVGPLIVGTSSGLPEEIAVTGAPHQAQAAPAVAASPVALGASPLVWAAIALGALVLIGGAIYLISTTAEAMGATLMAYRHATHEERWWDDRTRFVLECLRLYPNDEALRTRCIASTPAPRPAPPTNPFSPPAGDAPGWVPWTVAGLGIAVLGVTVAAFAWGSNKLPGVRGIDLDVRTPGTPEMR